MVIDAQTEIMHVVHSLSGGGTERSMVAMLSRMNLPQVQQQVITLRKAGDLVTALPDHVSCRALDKKGRSRTSFISLARLSRGHRILIHARNTCCWADATLASILNPEIKLVLGFHGLETQGSLPLRHRWVARIAHFLGGRFVSVSEAGRTLIHQQAGIPHDRIDVIYTGIDRKKFNVARTDQRDKARQQLGLAKDSLAIGCVGSLTPIKNQELLLRAFAQLLQSGVTNSNLVLIGDGSCGPSLRRLAKHLGIESHITWLGQCRDIAPILAALDVYVCSSHSEGISNAMLEAMACGLPIVTTDVGDHGLVVRDGIDGIVLHETSADELSEALVKLAGSHSLREAMGLSARARSASYDMGNMVARYESFYMRCLFPTGATMVPQTSKAFKQARGAFAHAEGDTVEPSMGNVR